MSLLISVRNHTTVLLIASEALTDDSVLGLAASALKDKLILVHHDGGYYWNEVPHVLFDIRSDALEGGWLPHTPNFAERKLNILLEELERICADAKTPKIINRYLNTSREEEQ